MKEIEYTNETQTKIVVNGKYMGVPFEIINYGTHPCAYIGFPEEPSELIKIKISNVVHGGITYAEYAESIEHEIFNYLIANSEFVIGWDYMHWGDYDGAFPDVNKKKWRTEEILNEVKAAIDEYISCEVKE